MQINCRKNRPIGELPPCMQWLAMWPHLKLSMARSTWHQQSRQASWRCVPSQRSTSFAIGYEALSVLRHLPLSQPEAVLQIVTTGCHPVLQEAILQTDAIVAKRRMLIGPNTALSYDAPLHIVRGEGSHLFDAEGIDYLDCCNNVAHVGHCHPKVSERPAWVSTTVD